MLAAHSVKEEENLIAAIAAPAPVKEEKLIAACPSDCNCFNWWKDWRKCACRMGACFANKEVAQLQASHPLQPWPPAMPRTCPQRVSGRVPVALPCRRTRDHLRA